ncbi:MAG TPA: winged helix DNA-binding domain-containing protein [Candidatus Limnocylindria bacterium]|nr:winged helix DNA-binding domain-containing protein [Candidatus Limnocylindria bacterium]
MNISDIARLRLRVQRLALDGDQFAKPEQVVGWLGAVQSQEYQLARWSVGQRLKGAAASASAVESAIASGRILRTHILRPTWHFVLPRDIRWMMRLTGPRWAPVVTRRHMQLGIGPADYQRALDSMTAALAGGKHLTRPELGAAIERGGVNVDGQRLAFIVMAAETSLVLASGSGQNYALLPQDPAESFDRDEALKQMALRYFTGHGPATIADFTWWSTLTVADARRGIAAAGASLSKLTIEGTDYWLATDTADGPSDPSPTFHLLQGYDEYVVGYRSPRDPINLERLGPHTALNTPSWLNGLFLDGQLIGWWRRVRGKAGASVETRLLRELSTREKSALGQAIDRYSTFTE